MMRWFGWLLAAWGGIVPACVLAAGAATVQAGDRTLTVSFDGPDARVDISGVAQGYLLMRDGKLYSVMRAGGRPLVMDGDAVVRLLGGAAIQTGPDMIRSLTRIEPTGARETVAGRAGAVYAVSYRDEQGRSRSGQGVLGKQPEVREPTRALGRMAVLLQTAAGQSPDGAAGAGCAGGKRPGPAGLRKAVPRRAAGGHAARPGNSGPAGPTHAAAAGTGATAAGAAPAVSGRPGLPEQACSF